MENGIKSMQELFDKVAAMNSDYYDLRGKIVSKERRISVLTERLEMWEQYQKYKPVRQKLDKVAPGKREQFEQRHSADLALFDAAVRYLDTLKTSGESITPKAWRAEATKLTAEKEADYLQMRAMREDIKVVETLKKTTERLAREGQTQRREEQER
jgi:chromosome segregation ATPase